MPPSKPPYSTLPTASTSHLSPRPHRAQPPSDSEELETQERGRRAEEETEREDDDDEGDGNGREGLLSGVKREEEGKGVLLVGKDKEWLGKVKMPTLRTTLLSLLAIVVILLLGFLFHPSSPYSKPLESYYSGAPLAPGTYNSDGILAPNPLPEGAKFGDAPFASVGASKAAGTAVPAWAGGDGGAKAEESVEENGWKEGRRWNGTHWFERTVILVSLDGVRADYLARGLTPELLGISKKGLPVFPSLTFPNHWSLMSGLYPSSHGIVANDFWDPALQKEFVYTEPTKSWGPEWWGGEPLWSTALKNGLRSAVLMWPGPPIMKDGAKPSLWYPFQNDFHHSKKVDKLAEWLDLPLKSRPHLITAYAPEVDQEGHRTGPHSAAINETLLEMDAFAKGLFVEIEKRNLTDVVDVIFVSDHGMTETHNERLVFLDDILGEEGWNGIERNEGWPSAGLRFASHVDVDEILRKLVAASEASNGGFNVYTAETMPERFHFTGNERIAPIYVVPHVGWAISSHHDFHIMMNGDYTPKGNHGYDPEDSTMHAIFVAHGPFASSLKAGLRKRATFDERADGITVIPGFANLEIYNLVARLLAIEVPAPNNGTQGFWERYLD